MRRLLWLMLALLPTLATAQEAAVPRAKGTITVDTAPTGSCDSSLYSRQFRKVKDTGDEYTCVSGVWTRVGLAYDSTTKTHSASDAASRIVLGTDRWPLVKGVFHATPKTSDVSASGIYNAAFFDLLVDSSSPDSMAIQGVCETASGASSGTVCVGGNFEAYPYSATGTVAGYIGARALMSMSAGTTATNLYGFHASTSGSGGSLTNIFGGRFEIGFEGTATNAAGVSIGSPDDNGAGGISNWSSLSIADPTGVGTTTSDAISIASSSASSATKGNIRLSGGDWHTGHVQLNTGHLWSTSGAIRIKSSAPSSATDFDLSFDASLHSKKNVRVSTGTNDADSVCIAASGSAPVSCGLGLQPYTIRSHSNFFDVDLNADTTENSGSYFQLKGSTSLLALFGGVPSAATPSFPSSPAIDGGSVAFIGAAKLAVGAQNSGGTDEGWMIDPFDYGASFYPLGSGTPSYIGKKPDTTVARVTEIYAETLDVSQPIRLSPTDSPGTCNAGAKGYIYYDLSVSALCHCDGASWKKVDGGGAC